ncbi:MULTISPECIES: hypothetical protein [Arthrobacter]|uniref:Uncharacterized protein n=1 Tax=Arthrobacter terricola TaxID=2547396 RepID=A0A4R5KA21_9MICC|nr:MULTISPECIES: hypothetical protein [Arthrobacter]MBT8162800.1 hypothetical protein [Arthrobacter sp. GN70]TDF92041.1 hypothetical protein E1809_18855 [Arthrobacter terricola]
MSKFSARVAVHSEDGSTTWFNPGDEVPDWAEHIVGKHCLEPEVEPDVPDFTADAAEVREGDSEDADKGAAESEDEPEGEGDAAASDDVDTDSKTDVPDFTAPAARRGRPRKS